MEWVSTHTAGKPQAVIVQRTEHLTEDIVELLKSFDASFMADSVIAVEQLGDGGYQLTERPLAAPFRKRYRIDRSLVAGEAPPWDELLLASWGGEVQAMAATTFEAWSQRQRVDELHVLPAARNRGVARELMTHVRSIATANAARELWLETQNVNVPAVRAYQKMGFTFTGIDTSRYPHPYQDEVALFLSSPLDPPPGPKSASRIPRP